MPERDHLLDLDKDTLVDLLEDAAKNWLAHDGLWFQAVEKEFGMETALKMDAQAWKIFTQLEAKQIMRRLGLEPGGGIEAMEQALRYRLYARINEQEIYRSDPRTLRFEMKSCRVQVARERKGRPPFVAAIELEPAPIPSIRSGTWSSPPLKPKTSPSSACTGWIG